MKKLLGSGLALGLAAAGTMLLAGPGSAQDGVLHASLSATEVTPDGSVTITGDPCPGTAEWGIFEETDPVGTPAFDGGVTNAAGGLSLTIPAPDQPAVYVVQVSCDGDDYVVAGSDTGENQGSIDFVFEVKAGEAPPTTAPAAPAPAPAVPGRPNTSG